MKKPALILASQSPRRRALLEEAGYEFEVQPPADGAESGPSEKEAVAETVARLALEKGANVAPGIPEGLVLSCDTLAECDGQLLGKPADRQDAERMLRRMRGQRHRVWTGVCLWRRPDDHRLLDYDCTELVMESISDGQLAAYLESGDWEGKAGAFGYQDDLPWIEILSGSPSNVIGLPLELLARMLERMESIPLGSSAEA